MISEHNAILKINRKINIDHDRLLKMLEERVDDKSFLRLVKKWLKAGVLEEDKSVLEPEKGTPQGGSVSPILANVYLHYAFDLWFQKVVGKQAEAGCSFVSHADDFVCLFRSRAVAERFYEELPRRLAKFGLEVAKDKTRIIHFSFAHGDNSFDFPGFEFRWRISRKGRPYLSPRTSIIKHCVPGITSIVSPELPELQQSLRHDYSALFCVMTLGANMFADRRSL